MGASKKEIFSTYQNQIACIAKALGHPARIAIVEYLLKVEGCICSDIVDNIQLAQPTVSQHLRELKEAGIIKGSIEKNAICYCLNENTLEILSSFLVEISQKIELKKCC
jgi:ArsR family transcriptional regulator, arsenate/arsenite/antimonite-responsive transcriptional repressor